MAEAEAVEQIAYLLKKLKPDVLSGAVELVFPGSHLVFPDGYRGYKLNTFSAAQLQRENLKPVEFVVEGLLPCGLSILASPPKFGKSWMVLNLCLSAAEGDDFLGFRTHPVYCLYLALEDSKNRLQRRMKKLLKDRMAPGMFDFAISAATLDNGLLSQLSDYLSTHPHCKLIVIDTLQKVRGAVRSREGAYSADYREVGALKKFADEHNIALLLVHHLRKMGDDSDPFNRISGTNGISGAADTTFVLSKEKRSDDTATLSIVGRDVESKDLVLKFDDCQWYNMGDAESFKAAQVQKVYTENPIRHTVLELLRQSPENEWVGTASELIEAGERIAHTKLATNARDLSYRLKEIDHLLLNIDGVGHDRQKNGSGGGRHRFFKKTTA